VSVRGLAALALPAWTLLASAAFAQAPAPPVPNWFARNTTRVESWSFFEPPPGGGDPTSTYAGTRLQIGVRRTTARVEMQAAVQFVQLGWLPEGAVGPGPLGLGAVYFEHAGTPHPRELYLKYLNARFKDFASGLSLQLGRFGYTSGAEAASGVPKIEALKRLRVDSRLIGEFEFSFFQRSFDGARLDYVRPRARVTGAAFFPTQGGFEEDANRTMTDVRVVIGALTLPPGAPLARTEWQIFAARYDDDRRVTARPDNSGQSAARADVHVTTFGTTFTGTAPAGAGELDALIWIALQTGEWYGGDHRAFAGSLEAGYQWTNAGARPWIRGGWLRASGDSNPADGRHGTFFQMLPTVRRHALSATYSQMNLRDLFAELLASPSNRVNVRAEIHRLDLDRPADRWYSGSGATQRQGSVFGFSGRPSGGATRFGTVLEGGFEVVLPRRWTIGGYVGRVAGGDVVTRQFAGDRLTFAFIELVKMVN
jgi:hypothetical protein